jgi:Na+/citrate or Na+/malate symporter
MMARVQTLSRVNQAFNPMRIKIKSLKISLPWWLVLLIIFVVILALKANPHEVLEVIKEVARK